MVPVFKVNRLVFHYADLLKIYNYGLQAVIKSGVQVLFHILYSVIAAKGFIFCYYIGHSAVLPYIQNVLQPDFAALFSVYKG